jgi:XTP/dITP diphosphohydrolase
MRVVLATGNVGKQRELAALLAPRGYELLLQKDLGVASVEETGESFEANALLKARHAARLTGLPALADDSGLEVVALGGRPGVRSARYAGEDASDADNVALLLRELVGVPDADRGARFRCVIAFVRDATDPEPLVAYGVWEGHIGHSPQGSGGFGYDPVFLPQGPWQGRSVAALSDPEKNGVSHRALALAQLMAQLLAPPPGSGR